MHESLYQFWFSLRRARSRVTRDLLHVTQQYTRWTRLTEHKSKLRGITTKCYFSININLQLLHKDATRAYPPGFSPLQSVNGVNSPTISSSRFKLWWTMSGSRNMACVCVKRQTCYKVIFYRTTRAIRKLLSRVLTRWKLKNSQPD